MFLLFWFTGCLHKDSTGWHLFFICLCSCKSFVGCQGGAQRLYYARSCSVGNLCHEIIHALGLHHEHTRKDRDQYISVLWDNIMPGKFMTEENKFKSIQDHRVYNWKRKNGRVHLPAKSEKQAAVKASDIDEARSSVSFVFTGMKKHFNMKRGNSLNLPYDLQSIMHYGPWVTWRFQGPAVFCVWTTPLIKASMLFLFADISSVWMEVRLWCPKMTMWSWVRGLTSARWISRDWTDFTTAVQ